MLPLMWPDKKPLPLMFEHKDITRLSDENNVLDLLLVIFCFCILPSHNPLINKPFVNHIKQVMGDVCNILLQIVLNEIS